MRGTRWCSGFHQSVDDAKCHPQAGLAQVLLPDKGQGPLGEPGRDFSDLQLLVGTLLTNILGDFFEKNTRVCWQNSSFRWVGDYATQVSVVSEHSASVAAILASSFIRPQWELCRATFHCWHQVYNRSAACWLLASHGYSQRQTSRPHWQLEWKLLSPHRGRLGGWQVPAFFFLSFLSLKTGT